MQTEELLAKLNVIEEQARRTLDEALPQRAQIRWAVAEDNLP